MHISWVPTEFLRAKFTIYTSIQRRRNASRFSIWLDARIANNLSDLERQLVFATLALPFVKQIRSTSLCIVQFRDVKTNWPRAWIPNGVLNVNQPSCVNLQSRIENYVLRSASRSLGVQLMPSLKSRIPSGHPHIDSHCVPVYLFPWMLTVIDDSFLPAFLRSSQ